MGWEKTIPVSELPEGGRKVVTVDSKPVLLINHCNRFYAISSTCPHWGLPLELGRLTDDCGIICPWHRSGFDLDTGDVKAWAPWPPGLGLVLGATSRRKVLPTYPTRVEDDAIWVSLDPDAAVEPAHTTSAMTASTTKAETPLAADKPTSQATTTVPDSPAAQGASETSSTEQTPQAATPLPAAKPAAETPTAAPSSEETGPQAPET